MLESGGCRTEMKIRNRLWRGYFGRTANYLQPWKILSWRTDRVLLYATILYGSLRSVSTAKKNPID